MIIHKVEQGTPEWEMLRKNVITGTKAESFKPKVRGTGYRAGFFEMLADDIDTEEHNENPMDWGVTNEPKAREEYTNITGNKVEEYGFCTHDEYSFIGYSPDGVVLEKKKPVIGLEIKCPTTKVYVEYFIETCIDEKGVAQKQFGFDKIPDQYKIQVIQSFLVNKEQKELHFFIYNPTLAKNNWIIIYIERAEIKDEIEEQLKYQIDGYKKYLELKALFIDF